ncbi:hypothetical protein Tco_0103456 [Tanacetum coccineum]
MGFQAQTTREPKLKREPDTHIDRHPLIASQDVVLDRLKSFHRGTSCERDGLRAQHLMDCLSGAVVAISYELVPSITQVCESLSCRELSYDAGEYIASAPLYTFGVGIPGGGEAILHAVNRLVEDHRDDFGLSMLLVDFQNAFNLSSATLALPDCTTENTPCGRAKGCSRSEPSLATLLVFLSATSPGKVLELITEDGPRCGLHLNVDKTELFWPKEDPRSRLEGVFPPNISRPLHGVKLLGGPVSVDPDFSNALVMKRVSKTIRLLDAVAKINDPQCELLLIRACAGISKLYFAMRTCPPRVFESAQLAFDMALRSALERIVTASGPRFGDWQWRLATLPFAFGGLDVYSAGDVLNYAFVSSRLQPAALQTRLLRHVGLAAYGSHILDDLIWPYGKFSKEEHTSELASCGFRSSGWTKPKKRSRAPACSKGLYGDCLGYRCFSCAGVYCYQARHYSVRDTLVDICFRSGISAGKEVDIGLGGGCDKALRPANMLLYSWEGG